MVWQSPVAAGASVQNATDDQYDNGTINCVCGYQMWIKEQRAASTWQLKRS